MACFKPLHAFISCDPRKKTKTGKSGIFFKARDAGNLFVRIDLPCGQCIGCRIRRSKEWALRCYHEASLYSANCFITLTYNKKNLPKNGSLNKGDFQKFMKRLRRKFKGVDCVATDSGKLHYPIRYFHCGEYGDCFSRPHHHACLFNFDFDDKIFWKKSKGNYLYISESLERLWSKEINKESVNFYGPENCYEVGGKTYTKIGYCLIGDVTIESAAYVARYIIKKVNGDKAAEHYVNVDEETGEVFYMEPEFVTMSRRPGVGKGWFKKFSSDVFPKDFISSDGKRYKVPKYYDKLFDSVSPQDFLKIRKKRLIRGSKFADNDRRLAERCVAVRKKLKVLERSFENGNEVV